MQPTITKVDPRAGTVTVKMAGRKGKDVEKVFQLTEDVEYVDSTGRVACLDVLRCDNDILVIEIEGQIKELQRATPAPSRPPASQPEGQAAVAAGDKGHNGESVSEEDIRHCAYQKWENAGRPPGDGVQFWLEAEHELVPEPQATV